MQIATLFEPPYPSHLPPVLALLRTMRQGDGNLLNLLPAAAYRMDAGELGYSLRSIKLFNEPSLVREILNDNGDLFPKSDLMVGALDPLIGGSMFVTDGPKWKRQRAMIDPAFSHMRLNVAFGAMQAAIDDYEAYLGEVASRGEEISLDLAMSHLTADIICRTVFSVSLESNVAREVFDDFTLFEKGVGQVRIFHMISKPAWADVPQDADVLAACTRIRDHIGALIDTHMGEGADQYNDIATAVIAARDTDTGEGFTRDELIDQLGVFFLAGHETTASALTWAFYVLGMRPDIMAGLRKEVDEVFGDGEITFEGVKSLIFTRSVFKETLRLYPPITFLPRVALKSGKIGKYRIRKGALIMIAPWTLHRHVHYWTRPNTFDPVRFMPGGEGTKADGTYLPYGAGPHTCVGAGFANIESALILARLCRRFEFDIRDGEAVRPAARLTTRPVKQVMVRPRAV